MTIHGPAHRTVGHKYLMKKREDEGLSYHILVVGTGGERPGSDDRRQTTVREARTRQNKQDNTNNGDYPDLSDTLISKYLGGCLRLW